MTGTQGPPFDLGDAAERVHIRPGDVTAVVVTARRRTARRRRALAGVTAFTLVVSATAAVRLTESSEDGGVPLAASGGARQGKVGVTWQRVDPKTTLGMARGFSDGSPIYALSTAPGERESRAGRPLSRVVWKSADGVEWTPASTLGPDLYLSDLANRDNRVYAVGTSPTSSAPSTPGTPAKLTSADLVVGWSDDDARTWQKQTLPLDLKSVPTRTGFVSDVEVASGPSGVLAVAVLSAQLEVPALLPAGVTAPNGWATTDTGVDLVGPVRSNPCPDGFKQEKHEQPEGSHEVTPTWCSNGDKGVTITPQDARGVTAHYTWEQLGVEGDVLHAVRRQAVAFFARSGSTDFQRVALPDLPNVSFLSVGATDRGFDLVAAAGDRYGRQPGRLTLLQSTDGRTWTKGSPPDDDHWVSAVGTVKGRTAMVTGNDTGGGFTMADGAGGWSTVSWDELFDDDVLQGRHAFGGTAAIGPFGIVVSVVLSPPEGGNEKQLSSRLLVSRDGEVWEDISLDDLVGQAKAAVHRITMAGDKVVVAASVPVDRTDLPRRQIDFIGTAD
jgi:hypothetical protein